MSSKDKDEEKKIINSTIKPSNSDEITFLMDDFRDTSSKLESTDRKVQFFIQTYIAFITAVIGAFALFLFSGPDLIKSKDTGGKSDTLNIPFRISSINLKLVENKCEAGNIDKGLKLKDFYSTDTSGKLYYLSFKPCPEQLLKIRNKLSYARYVERSDYRLVSIFLLVVFMSLLTKFLLKFIDKAGKVHDAYIHKMNIIRSFLIENEAFTKFHAELFIYRPGKKPPSAGMNKEIIWLLKVFLLLLVLFLVVFSGVLVMSFMMLIFVPITFPTKVILASICLLVSAILFRAVKETFYDSFFPPDEDSEEKEKDTPPEETGQHADPSTE